MAVGAPKPWTHIALAGLLLAVAVPVAADRPTATIEDEDAVLVGDPTGLAAITAGEDVEVGTQAVYQVPVEPADNRLEIDLTYDAGELTFAGPCLRANDLDLVVEGPGWGRTYDGCDDGHISLIAEDIPTGEYTVRVEAEQGSTLCVPLGSPTGCSDDRVDYRIEIRVWEVT